MNLLIAIVIAVVCVLGLAGWAAAGFEPWLADTAWPRIRARLAGPGRHRAPMHPVAAVRRPAGAGRRAR